jgi:molecular chaperone DnaK
MGSDQDMVLGIDFGTSNCSAAAVVDGRVQLVFEGGVARIPNVVHVPSRGGLIVGREAAHHIVAQPHRTITSLKRVLGRSYADPELRSVVSGVGYRLAPGQGGMCLIEVDGQTLAPVQVAAAMITHLRELAERRFATRIERAFLSVPVDATKAYAEALSRAASLAGLRAVRLAHEPVAGAIGCGLGPAEERKRIAVCDFGGGTFDCALLVQDPSGLQLVASAGDPFLGGDDFDTAFADSIAGAVFREHRIDLRHDIVRWAALVRRCEAAKRILTTRQEVVLHLPGLFSQGGVSHDLKIRVTRESIEPRWHPMVDRASTLLQRVLAKASWPNQLVDEMFLVGGTNLVPIVRQGLGLKLARRPAVLPTPDVAGVVGLALLGAAAAHEPWEPGLGARPQERGARLLDSVSSWR